MKQVIIFHGAFSNPTHAWYQSVQSILPNGYTLVTPELPGGAEQGMTFWMKSVQSYIETLSKDTIVISHGISSLLVLRILELLHKPIRSYICVAGCSQAPTHKVFAPIAETFLQTPFQWQSIIASAGAVTHILNKQDPYINAVLSEDFSRQLPGTVIKLSGTNHFNETDEPDLFRELNTLFRDIESYDLKQDSLQKQHREQIEKEELAKSLVPGVITYDSVKAQSLLGYQGKVISELLTEARIHDEQVKTASPKNIKNIFYIIGSIFLFLISIGALIYALNLQLPQRAALIQKQTSVYQNTILQPDSSDFFELSNLQNFELLKNFRALQTKEISEKTIHVIVPTENEKPINLETFASILSITTPLGLTSKADDFLYGYYRPENSNQFPFLLIRFNGYGIIQQIMSRWESSIIFETRTWFQSVVTDQLLLKPEPAPFQDIITNNIPLRTATLSTGETLYYGFLTDTTLIITTSDQVIKPLLRRMVGR